MARFTNLDGAAMGEVARRFGLGSVEGFTALDAGTINSNFSLRCARGVFFVRVNEGKTADEVAYEGRLVEALSAAGIPAPVPLAVVVGDTEAGGAGVQRFATVGTHLISVFAWVAGGHLDRGAVTADAARQVGGLLARLHLVAEGLGPGFDRAGIYTFEAIAQRCDDLSDHPDTSLAPSLAILGEERRYLAQHLAARAALPGGVIHGDLFRDNVLFEGDRLAAVIDFEQAALGSFAYDLAVAINAWCFDDSFAPALVSAMVAGYQEVRPLTEIERAGLGREGRAAAWRFAVTRITDVYLRGRHSPEKDYGRYIRRLLAWRDGLGELA